MISDKSKVFLLKPKEGYEYDSIFSNYSLIPADTIWNMKEKGYNFRRSEKTIALNVYSKKLGMTNVRTILKEVDTVKGKIEEHEYFIDLEYEVIP